MGSFVLLKAKLSSHKKITKKRIFLNEKTMSALNNWKSTYSMTYDYSKNPDIFHAQEVFHHPASIQNPSKRCSPSYKYLNTYIPKLKNFKPPGVISNDAKALSLGTFDKINLKDMYEIKSSKIAKSNPRQSRKDTLSEKNVIKLDLNEQFSKREREKYKYLNLSYK